MKLIEVLLEQENMKTESVKSAIGSMALAALTSLGTATAASPKETLPVDATITVVNQQNNLKYANNPGNIRYNSANKWLGQVKPEAGFAQFSDIKYGIRAIVKLLKKYETSYKLNTITDIITKYAPANENKTEDYIKFVSDKIGLGPTEKLNLFSTGKPDIDGIIKVVNAITKFETGTIYTPTVITNAISLL
jgi:hypothetical protein